MKKQEILEMPNFQYTPHGFEELKAVLKEGKTVRNPFAKYYNKKVEVTVVQDTEEEQFITT